MLFAATPALLTLTRVVVPVRVSRTKMSSIAFVSPETRFEALDWNATYRPSDETAGDTLLPFDSAPAAPTLTRVVTPAWRSRTKTSATPFVSPLTKLLAQEVNATYLPSPETTAFWLRPFACAPLELTFTRSVAPLTMSWTKMSHCPLVSEGTKLEALDLNATMPPLAEIEAQSLALLPCVPDESTLARHVCR